MNKWITITVTVLLAVLAVLNFAERKRHNDAPAPAQTFRPEQGVPLPPAADSGTVVYAESVTLKTIPDPAVKHVSTSPPAMDLTLKNSRFSKEYMKRIEQDQKEFVESQNQKAREVFKRFRN
jgi:predicted helicase